MTTTLNEFERPPQVVRWRFAAIALLAAHATVCAMAIIGVVVANPALNDQSGTMLMSHPLGEAIWLAENEWLSLLIAGAGSMLSLGSLVRLWRWKGRLLSALVSVLLLIAVALLIVPHLILMNHGQIRIPGPGSLPGYYRSYDGEELIGKCIAAALLLLPTPVLLIAWLRQRRTFKRVRRDECGFCGFDLRAATGDRCTECGRSNSEILLPERRTLTVSG